MAAMLNREAALSTMIQKLERHRPFSSWDRKAILSLPIVLKTLETAAYLLREGQNPTHCCLLLSGYLYRHKMTGSGLRQIVSLHMRGDLTDLQNTFLRVADHNLQTLTRAEVALIPRRAIEEIAL